MPKYRVVYADPPWPEPHSFVPVEELKGLGVSTLVPVGWADRHYKLMSMDALRTYKLPSLAQDCFLFLWCPFRKFEEAIDLMRHWDFTYCKTGIVWVKTSRNGGIRMGMGVRIRMCHELLLLGVRGRPRKKNCSTKSVLIAPYRKHSQKPDEAYVLIEQYADGPYIELFARNRRPGWKSRGNEVR